MKYVVFGQSTKNCILFKKLFCTTVRKKYYSDFFCKFDAEDREFAKTVYLFERSEL